MTIFTMIKSFLLRCMSGACTVAVLVLSCNVDAQAESTTLSGFVRSAASGEPVPSAIVRALNTSRGTVCNSEGAYRLTLERGEYLVVASSLGFKPDSVRISLPGSTRYDFSLTESAIILPEIVVSGEDPAYAIIRSAIANKQQWIDRLQSYQMSAFTRQILRRDTTIASITEAFTTGYWRQGDTLHEVTSQKRQTENIEQTMNFASVGRLLNFYENEIRFLRHSFIGPIADDAFDHYDFKLLRTRSSGRSEVYEIALIPLSDVVPRFRGTISIEGGTYALIGVDVEPNEAFLLPFIKEKTLRYRQQFSQFEGTYWLPADIRIDGRFRVGVPGFSLPDIGFSQTSVITDYLINIPIPDSIFAKPRLSVDSTVAAYDSTVWSGPGALPLTAEEQTAYQTLDSTQTLEVQFRPGGLAATLGGGEEGFSLLKYVDLEYNRVEGLHLGGALSFERLFNRLDVRGGYAYGFSDKQSKYYAGATVFLDTTRRWGIGVDYANQLSVIPEQGYYGKEFNSLTSLFVRNDYRDYYMSEGWEVFVSYEPTRRVRGKVTYVDQDHSDAMVNTDYGFFTGIQEFRENPSVKDGHFQSIQFELSLGRKREPLDIVARDGIDVLVETSIKDASGGAPLFTRYHVVGTLNVPTFGDRYFSPPGFRFRLAAGTYTGQLPPRQRVFSLESSSSGLGPFGVMRGLRVKEFLGREYIALSIEHNFRSLPFLWLDIPFLYRNNIEFIVHAGIAESGPDEEVSLAVGRPMGLPTIDGLYSEIGFGISRIFELVRCDFTWRLSDPKLFHFTLAVANFL